MTETRKRGGANRVENDSEPLADSQLPLDSRRGGFVFPNREIGCMALHGVAWRCTRLHGR
jgi:hypothetical protein